jgi:uncharacterized protein (DUF362 family)
LKKESPVAKPVVSVAKYEASPGSLERVLGLSEGLKGLRAGDRILIKPNLVGWDPVYPIAPYGVYTTTRLVEDMIIVLKEMGSENITIGEGSAPRGGQRGLKGTRLIFNALGYEKLRERYGVRLIDFFEEEFVPVKVGGFTLNFAEEALGTDFLINMPVLKTHNQTTLSLGLKNLKGCVDLKSRRLCHNADIPLDFFCALFAEALKPALTVLDGIYGLEKGPYYLGTAYKMDVLAASKDALAVDMLGAILAGRDPASVEHIRIFAERNGRSLTLDSLKLAGDSHEQFVRPLKCDFDWRADNTGPVSWDQLGIKGVSIPKYDNTICTGCSSMYNPLLMLITSAYRGEPFDGIEILTGKRMTPSPGFNRTILLGNCMIKKNRNHPNIREAVCIRGCPVTMEEIIGVLNDMGLPIDLEYFARFRRRLASRLPSGGRPSDFHI